MTKKIIATLLVISALFLFLGCAKQPAEEPIPAEVPEAVESIEEVGTGISDITSVDEELDARELDDLDTILESIENI